MYNLCLYSPAGNKRPLKGSNIGGEREGEVGKGEQIHGS